MHIASLREHSDLIPTLAAWHQGQWGHLNPSKTLPMRIASLERHLADAPIPATFVAVEDGLPLGSASLVERDLPTRPHLTPWLASVFVAPEHRRRGIASGLVRRVVEEAARLEIPTLYLFTWDQQRLYAGLGWTIVEETEYLSEPITVMSIEPR